jgi:nitrogen regulatory protein P-II 2
MQTHAMKLLTIVCEAHARGPVLDLLRSAGAHGWTLFSVEGEGAGGGRPADIPEFTNLQIQVVVRPEVAEAVLDRLGREFFPRYAMIAFAADVQVLRPGKF